MKSRWKEVVVALLCALVAAGFPAAPREPGDERDEWERFNERCAGDSLKTLTEVEADARANDRDWCHVNDFWTTNVEGLYTLTSAENAEGTLQRIELSVESADEELKQESP